MPRNTDKVPCGIPGCRAWAVRGSDPPRCSPHSGRAGAPPGNTNHFIHGYYTAVVPPEEVEGLSDSAFASTLDAEILIARAALRRLFQIICAGSTPGPTPKPLTAEDYARFIGLTFAGAGTIARLLRIRVALPHKLSDFEQMMEEILRDVGKELGADLLGESK
jgi:hypothetical protein